VIEPIRLPWERSPVGIGHDRGEVTAPSLTGSEARYGILNANGPSAPVAREG
jgi:hypothetical protein